MGDTADQLAKELTRLAEPALLDDYADAKADVAPEYAHRDSRVPRPTLR